MHASNRLFNDPLEGVHLKNGVVLLDQEVRRVAPVVQNHVGLPGFVGDTAVNAPPEIVLVLATPSKDRDALFCQCGRHLVLGTVNVACCPTHLKLKDLVSKSFVLFRRITKLFRSFIWPNISSAHQKFFWGPYRTSSPTLLCQLGLINYRYFPENANSKKCPGNFR